MFYNAYNSVTLQMPLILATLSADDDDETFRRKAMLVAGYLDIFVARCMVNAHDFRYTAVEHRLFALAREIRGMGVDALAVRLGVEVAAISDTFEAVGGFALRPRNRTYVKYLLSRMAAWLDERCGTGYTFADYSRSAKDQQPFEIEHIWADKHAYQPDVPRRKFGELRNRFGALLLLPKDFNASFGDKPYAKKLPLYMGQHLLVRSLHPDCYVNNPSFLRIVAQHELPFRPFPDEFDQAAIEHRQAAYRRLCEVVWAPEQYGLIVPATPPAGEKEGGRTRFNMTLRQLVEGGFLPAGSQLVGSYRGVDHKAEVTAEARIRVESGEEFEAVSPAAMAVLDKQSWNGWRFWQHSRPDGSLIVLDEVRRAALG
ncbi:GmrSD restriction endonuclease domain-containing protein [Dactylosporangium sp. CS-047395]|uniref:restriction system modified-DNA reader domain-containing protein n=1 Tax=Dactylosporangium sp. CS-047395 TaxID=3239936 RepID=UPI003D8CE455